MRCAFPLPLVVTLLLPAAPIARADDFRPLVIYQGDIPGNSFNQTIHDGVAQFTRKSGVHCEETVVGNDNDSYMKTLAEGCARGFNPILLIYGNHMKGLSPFVRSHPDLRFIVLGTVADEANMFSLDFAEHEGSFLAEALAAMIVIEDPRVLRISVYSSLYGMFLARLQKLPVPPGALPRVERRDFVKDGEALGYVEVVVDGAFHEAALTCEQREITLLFAAMFVCGLVRTSARASVPRSSRCACPKPPSNRPWSSRKRSAAAWKRTPFPTA